MRLYIQPFFFGYKSIYTDLLFCLNSINSNEDICGIGRLPLIVRRHQLYVVESTIYFTYYKKRALSR